MFCPFSPLPEVNEAVFGWALPSEIGVVRLELFQGLFFRFFFLIEDPEGGCFSGSVCSAETVDKNGPRGVLVDFE